LERGLDGGRDELRGLRVDDDVPAEQNAADHLPGVRGRVVRAGGGGEGPAASGSVTLGTDQEDPTAAGHWPGTTDLLAYATVPPG